MSLLHISGKRQKSWKRAVALSPDIKAMAFLRISDIRWPTRTMPSRPSRLLYSWLRPLVSWGHHPRDSAYASALPRA